MILVEALFCLSSLIYNMHTHAYSRRKKLLVDSRTQLQPYCSAAHMIRQHQAISENQSFGCPCISDINIYLTFTMSCGGPLQDVGHPWLE
uniref:Uncharacterized protein n=1 Tax=Aegilops tauschii subsp. strangulata TaxID=200361 RepID=A0A453N288_AEGTS